MFELLWKHPAAKYVGALGLFIPFMVGSYYVFVESWCLAYSFFSLTGSYFGLGSLAEVGSLPRRLPGRRAEPVLRESRGRRISSSRSSFGLNIAVLLGGVATGIERLALRAMPLLFVFAAILMVRVLTLDPPPGAGPDQNVLSGLGFIWNPNFAALADPKVWLAAAGQIFFTLSVGWGILHTYASYIGPDDDLALTGTATASLNEVAEVVLGGTIALTASVVFFGVAESMQIAGQGSFDLGFHAMPLVMEQIPGGRLFGAMWFFLLFLAGITSSVAMLQPTVALLREDFGFPRDRAVLLTGALLFLCAQPVFFFLGHGFMDQLDFWAGSFALLVFGFLEIVIFAWIFGMTEGWAEITRGARMKIPGVFRFVIQWVMPLGMGAILVAWSATELGSELSLEKVEDADRPYVIGARLLLVGVFVAFWLAVRAGSRRRAAAEVAADARPAGSS